MIKLNYEHVLHEIDFKKYRPKLEKINAGINNKTGAGNDYLGWADWPVNYDKGEFELIKKNAQKIREKYDTLVVTGIGGSYLGARAAIEAINGLMPQKGVESSF